MAQALNHTLMWAIFGHCHNAPPQGQGRVVAGAKGGHLLSGAVTRDMLRLEISFAAAAAVLVLFWGVSGVAADTVAANTDPPQRKELLCLTGGNQRRQINIVCSVMTSWRRLQRVSRHFPFMGSATRVRPRGREAKEIFVLL